MSRRLIYTYCCVGIGLALGLWIGIFVIDFSPRVVGWLFSIGAGVSGGAFVAAITTNTAIAGDSRPTPRSIPIDDFDLDDYEDDEPLEEPPSDVGSAH